MQKSKRQTLSNNYFKNLTQPEIANHFKVIKRSSPTLTMFTDSSPEIFVYPANATRTLLSGESVAITANSLYAASLRTTGGGTFSSNYSANVQFNSDFAFDAEL